MAKFIVVSATCMKCRAPIAGDGEALCERCEASAAELVIEKHLLLNTKERQFQELWTECQRCQGSVCQEVLCANRDCPIFYRREKVKKELIGTQEELAKLQLSWL